MTPRILLLGAGFSRNWGGWLADEVFEFLLGSSHVDDQLRSLLLSHRTTGFEAALDFLQARVAHSRTPDPQLDNLMKAIEEMFGQMNSGLSRAKFNPFLGDSNARLRIGMPQFLTRFDAIFTLNQDTLLEAHYVSPDIAKMETYGTRHWKGAVIPGLRPRDQIKPYWGDLEPDGTTPTIPNEHQPYIKLHGSSNWRTPEGNVMIIGRNKFIGIRNSALLDWNFRFFEDQLRIPACRLMVVGYSFRDNHINNAIAHAINISQSLEVFIVDPNGLDVVDPPSSAAIKPPQSEFASIVLPRIRGCSRRNLVTTIESDDVERDKLWRFLTGPERPVAPV